MSNLPLLAAIYCLIQMGFAAASACAFIFVIWPAIRHQEEVGKKVSDALDFYNSFKEKK